MLVKESISFQRYKDPKEALGMGLYAQRNFNSYKEYIDFLADNILLIIKEKSIPKESIRCVNIPPAFHSMKGVLYNKLLDYIKKYLTYHDNIIDSVPIESLYNELKDRGMINESISFQRYKDPMTALGLGERANLYRRSIAKLVDELKEEYPDYIGEILYPEVSPRTKVESFILGFYTKSRLAYFSISYSLPTKGSDDDIFLITYVASYAESNMKFCDTLEYAKDLLSKWIEDDIKAENEFNEMIKNRKKNRKIVNEALDKLTDEEICELIDKDISQLEDHLVFVLQVEGQEFIEKFNEYVRDMYPELKDDQRNFYKIYDKHRS